MDHDRALLPVGELEVDPDRAAEVLNDRFVNVKVDREERPDVDAVYMEVVTALTGRGGWPMTVFLTPEGEEIASALLAELSRDGKAQAPQFPEESLLPYCDNTWGDTGKAIVNNWLGLVYQLTNLDRKKQYMESVDPDDPLQLRDPR